MKDNQEGSRTIILINVTCKVIFNMLIEIDIIIPSGREGDGGLMGVCVYGGTGGGGGGGHRH